MSPRRRQVTYSNRPTHAARVAHAKGDRQFRTYDTSHIRPKRSKAPAIFAGVIGIIVMIAVVVGVMFAMRGCSQVELVPEGQEVEVVISEGEGASAVANSLVEAGLIADANEFLHRTEALGASSSLQPGTYTIAGGTSIDDIISAFQAGPGMTGDVLTLPEGLTLENTAKRVEEATGGRITAEDFTAAASDASAYAADYPFLSEAGTNSLEGFLFPKTYGVTDDMNAEDIVRMLLDQYVLETASLNYSYPEGTGLSDYEALVLASIVEKEATDSTRATIASVFYNRLAIDMPLQSDATTAYVVKRDPTADDISNDTTPYSTYQNYGLPPTPICSPSLASLQAVCAPETTDYYYFYFAEDDQGVLQYYFSETNDEHNAAVFGE